MRYALTTLACALVAGLAALMVGGGSRVPDPPPVQLVDDARTSQPAGKPARASRERGRREKTRVRSEGAANDGADGDRASAAAPSSPPSETYASPPPAAAAASSDDDDDGDDGDD
jgi:hypothetical protein